MTLSPGVYAIINKKSGTALTASYDTDHPTPITGNPNEETPNQKWIICYLGDGLWEIHKIEGEGAGFMGAFGEFRSTSLFVLSELTRWNIPPASEYGPDCYYIILPDLADYRATLANGGSSAPYTTVPFEPFVKGDESQVWEFRRLSDK